MSSTDNSSIPTNRPFIHLGAFLRAVGTPFIVWAVMVLLPTLAGQPGVVCLTPMAWLLALWSGGLYVSASGGEPDRRPMLGPALAGAGLGLGMGVLFSLVTTLAMPPASPDDLNKTIVLDVIACAAGAPIGAMLSVLTAWLTLRRYRREIPSITGESPD